MFGFNYTDGGPWSDDGVKAMSKFVKRFVNTFEKAINVKEYTDIVEKPEKDLLYTLNYTIKYNTMNLQDFQFNTAVSRIMVLTDALGNYLQTGRNSVIIKEVVSSLVKLMAPAAPHLTEELWSMLGNTCLLYTSRCV